MKNTKLGLFFTGLALPLCITVASAQTATWTGSTLTTDQDWNDGSHWDTGVAPNSPTAVAVIHSPAVATAYPGGGVRISSTTVNLAELRFDTLVPAVSGYWTSQVIVTAPYALPPIGSTLNLYGAGITTSGAAGADPRYLVSVGMGSQLHFYNHASIDGAHVAIGFYGTYSGFSGSVVFHDETSADNASISLASVSGGSITFLDQSTAATATLHADNLTFAGRSSADRARLYTSAYGETIYFRDQADAANATINLTRYGGVVFSDRSTASHATVTCSLESMGVVVYGQADVSGLILRSNRDESGRLSGAGGLDISGAAGNVAIGGLDGSVRVRLGANTLILGPSAVDQLLSGGIAGSGGLVLDTGRVVTVAPSSLFTPSENTYTGPTEVRSGSLHLVNSRVSPTTIAIGARLTGTGTVEGNFVNAGAVLPGSSAGTITVTENFVQKPTGVLGIDILSPTDFDRVIVGGTATLAGTLNLTGPGGLAPVGNASIPFLSAGTISGRFDLVLPAPGLVPGLGAARTAQVVYSDTGASYQVSQASFAGFGGSPASTALGAHLDATLANSTGEYRNLLARLNSLPAISQVATALETLSPDRYSILAENAFATASARRAATDRRLAARSSDTRDSHLFFEAGTRSATFDATVSTPKGRSRLDRGTAGLLWHNEPVSLGATLTYETGRVDLDQGGSTDNLRSFTPEFFLQYDPGNFFMNASIARSGDRHDLRRHVSYAGFDETATARPSGSRLDLGFTAGIPLVAGTWTVTPVAGLLDSRFKVDDFAESGALGANVAVSGWTNYSLRSHLGVEAARAGKFTPRLDVRWLHEFKDDRTFIARMAGAGGNGYSTIGREAEKDLVEASLSVSARLGKGAAGYLALGGAWGRNSRITSDLGAGISWQF